MKKFTTIATGFTLAALLATVATPAFAFERGGDDGERHRGGDRNGLVTQEERAEFRANFENLTEEERAAHKEERRAFREEQKAAFEEFSGLTREEVKEAKQNGESIGDVLTEQGITEAGTGVFLTEQANNKVDHIVETHNLDEAQETTLRDRIPTFVQNILNRWFGN